MKEPPAPLKASLLTVAGFFAILGLLSLAGGVCVLLRRMRTLALAGSISASVSLPPLGIPATVLMVLSQASKRTRLLVFILLGPLWLLYIGLLALILLGYSL